MTFCPAALVERFDHGSTREQRLAKAGGTVIALVKRAWLPVLVVTAVVIGVVSVYNLRTVFGSEGAVLTPVGSDTADSFNPKIVTYEVFGSGTSAVVNYTDLDGAPQRAGHVALPWSLRLRTTAPSVTPNLVAQGDGQSIGCRVTVNGEVKDQRSSEGSNSATYCLVRAA